MPPAWCLYPGGELTLSVKVVDGVMTAYLPDEDVELAFDGVDQLLAWIDANERRFGTS